MTQTLAQALRDLIARYEHDGIPNDSLPTGQAARAALADEGDDDPTWVLLSRPGMAATRKGPFRDYKHVEQMVRDLYALHPDATCLVIDAPHTMYPYDGREWVAMFGDQRRKAIPPSTSAADTGRTQEAAHG